MRAIEHTFQPRNRRHSLNSLFLFLGAKKEDVYAPPGAHPRRTNAFIDCGQVTLRKRYDRDYMQRWLKRLYRSAVKRHQENEEMIKAINIARDKALHILSYW